MSLSLLLALATVPAMLGTQEAIRDSQRESRREEYRSQRTNLVVSCVKKSIRARDIDQKLVVLKDNKLYIDAESSDPSFQEGRREESTPHPFAGYFLPYPDSTYEGLVSTITSEAPILNWIYVDRETHEVKYGVREFAQPNITGPFDWTHGDRRLTFESWEGFAAVEEYPGMWALYFDRDDTGLQGKLPYGTRVLEIEVNRREKKIERPPQEEKPMTMEQKMAELQKQRRQEEAEAKVEAEKRKQEVEALRRQEQLDAQAAEAKQRGQSQSRPRSVRRRSKKGNQASESPRQPRTTGTRQQQEPTPQRSRGATGETAVRSRATGQTARRQEAKPTALDMLDSLLQSEAAFTEVKQIPASEKDSGYDSAVASEDDEQTRKRSFVAAPSPMKAQRLGQPPGGNLNGNSAFSMGQMARALRPESDIPSPTFD